jgi:hypothetical protein
MRKIRHLKGLLALVCAFAAVMEPLAAQSDVEFFENEVRPILVKRCYECHSQAEGPNNGGLVLETAAGIAAGGSRGVLFSTEDPHTGLLLASIRYTDPDLEMPPDGRLEESERKVLEHWVLSGAALPEYKTEPRPAGQSIDLEAGRRFWAFQPLDAVPIPAVEQTEWVRRPLDAFVLAKLEEHDLSPSPSADKSALLRRLSFDLIGLPPTLDELTEFLNDTAPNAFEKQVDRLLASPHFGERWARVWLDLARYTDFTPDWQNPTDRGWLYRDWVVKAFNDNLPYDDFVRLQLAADLLPETSVTDLAALGFIGLSPTYWKELQLAPPVIEQIVADEWDERIDAVSRTFLGLTISCARCHDHKFDPISMEDYYGLAGVFASTQLYERQLLPDDVIVAVNQAKQQIVELEDKLKTLRSENSPDAESVAQQIQALKDSTPHLTTPAAHILREAAMFVKPDGEDRTKLEYVENTARDLPIFRRGNPSNPGPIVPRRFPAVFASGSLRQFTSGSGRAELAEALFRDAQGLAARVIVNRIWDQHFNGGLVRTPSDFGTQGDRPTHPELLDYLAQQFVEHNWDLKWLHREIVTSATWRQSGAFREDADRIDPANHLLWRATRRRLDIEMWRDATLAITGKLDLTIGGPSQAIDDLNNVRRTLYVTVAREELHPMLRMHDFPEASAHSPRREPTTTALQQLFVLNAPWMEQQSAALLERMQPVTDPEQRIRNCYKLLFCREPDFEEIQLGLDFVGSAAEIDVRWRDYFQALLGSNEFHFVD